ncbi:MAG TPA: hypothetical protein VHB21_09975, partial [Minicystis sp.]|nr:hypothetical protein [Minicystis sp.]
VDGGRARGRTALVSNLIGDLKQAAESHGVQQAKDELGKASAILDGGPPRAPTDVAKIEAKFLRGVDLATPDGGPAAAATSPSSPDQPAKPTTIALGKPIEFIHFGRVNRDLARSFGHDASIDDMQPVDLSRVVGSRAVVFRAALEREAVLLGGLAIATEMLLADKSQAEGKTSDLLEVASDLVGGASKGAAETAVAADLGPFLDQLATIWGRLNQASIGYDAIHEAGVKLHGVRVNLRAYLRTQLQSMRSGPAAGKHGLLSNLPLLGQVPIPGALGDVVGFMQKVTDEIQGVKIGMIFDLTLAMGPAMDDACQKATIDAIRNRRSPIYPVWYPPPPADGSAGAQKAPFASYDPGNVLQGDLSKIPGLGGVNSAVQGAVKKYYDDPLDAAAEKPLEVIDFLTKPVDPSPGSAFLAEAFQVTTAPDAAPGPLAGGKAIADLAYASFAKALGGSDSIPSFLGGFVQTFVTEVFHVSAEFLRAVYEKLCSLPPTVTISTDEIREAGRRHIVTALLDLALQKTGADGFLKGLPTPDIPSPPFVPPGVSWPKGKLSIEPVVAALKAAITDKLGPFLNPVVDFAMSGLATRLNQQRAWAGAATSMEAHLAELPGEMAVLFINLFGPLWGFLNQTLMHAVSDAMGKVVGPAAEAVGLAKGGLGKVTGLIEDAERKADQAQAWAKNVEDKVTDLLKKAQTIQSSLANPQGNLGVIAAAAKAVKDAATTDPFADDPEARKANPVAAASSFQPTGRISICQGKAADKDVLAAVAKDNQWDAALDSTQAAAEAGNA